MKQTLMISSNSSGGSSYTDRIIFKLLASTSNEVEVIIEKGSHQQKVLARVTKCVKALQQAIHSLEPTKRFSIEVYPEM